MKTASLRRIIYIVEDAQRFQNKGLSDQAFHQALANIEIQDGFLVKQTENLKKTADYLFMMTKYLQRSYAVRRTFPTARIAFADVAESFCST